MSALSGIATSVLVNVIEKVLTRDSVPVTNSKAPQIALEVAKELQPVIENQTNAEPWYQSRIFWTQAIAIVSGVVGLVWGLEISPQDRDLILLVVIGINSVVTPAGALYARFKTGLKPLGK